MASKQYSAPPAMAIDASKKYTATIEMEKGGEIEIELFAAEAPATVNNFVFLAREGYYDGVTFHRVIPGFHGAGRRPDRLRKRRTGLPVRRRVPSQPAARLTGSPVDGKRGRKGRARHEWQPVLHNFRSHAASGRPSLGVRQGSVGHGCGQRHSGARPDAFPRARRRDEDYPNRGIRLRRVDICVIPVKHVLVKTGNGNPEP